MAATEEVPEQEEEVIIVGAGQSGLAAAACLSLRRVHSLILERDDCVASLWRHRTYDRVRLDLAKHHCTLPHALHDTAVPTYLPRDDFVRYLDAYVNRFAVCSHLRRRTERYSARHLVAATGKNDEKVVPEVPGLNTFPGKVVHASDYRSVEEFKGKLVLVVGCGNSGIEITYDLAVAGSATSIVVCSKVHLVSKEIWNMAMTLYRYLPLWVIDKMVLLMCAVVFGDTARYGLWRPAIGPFTMKLTTPMYPVYDVGTFAKIRSGEIHVVPAAPKSIHSSDVEFANGMQHAFDAIVFATGYRSTTKQWLKAST
ncbi:hypothetical protein ABZP36_015388 [Zizania latifolia]